MPVPVAVIIIIIVVGINIMVCGSIGQSIAEKKGYDDGFKMGALLGEFGLWLISARPDKHAYSSGEGVLSRHSRKKKEVSESDWQCACGRMNASYVGTCVCGRHKSDSVTVKKAEALSMLALAEREKAELAAEKAGVQTVPYAVRAAAEEAGKKASDPQTEKQEKLLRELEILRKMKELLECGAITQEEFDRKKKEVFG